MGERGRERESEHGVAVNILDELLKGAKLDRNLKKLTNFM